MKINNWSLSGIIIGAIFSISSWIRYFIYYPDLDKALVYILIGVIIIALSWIYNCILNIQNSIIAIEDYLDDKREVQHG